MTASLAGGLGNAAGASWPDRGADSGTKGGREGRRKERRKGEACREERKTEAMYN